ncbi:MAG: hypothetical protein F6K56_32170 [Moorea sp. SIO3G5]|nr:hypothetical protein [Moorena sp. SIO3G5]
MSCEHNLFGKGKRQDLIKYIGIFGNEKNCNPFLKFTAFFITIRYTGFLTDSRFPIPDSRFPAP